MVYQSDEGVHEAVAMATHKTGWSASGKLHTINRSERVSLQVNFPIAGSHSIQFNLTTAYDPTGLMGANILRAEADITWSVEGNEVVRRVTVGDGVTVSGVGQAVRVVVRDVTRELGFGFGTNIEYTISILVAPGTRPAVGQPPTLEVDPGNASMVNSLAAGATALVAIPRNVGAISLLVQAARTTFGSAMIVTVAQRNGLSFGLVNYELATAPGIFVPLSAGATSVFIANQSAVGIVYSIALGIDG